MLPSLTDGRVPPDKDAYIFWTSPHIIRRVYKPTPDNTEQQTCQRVSSVELCGARRVTEAEESTLNVDTVRRLFDRVTFRARAFGARGR